MSRAFAASLDAYLTRGPADGDRQCEGCGDYCTSLAENGRCRDCNRAPAEPEGDRFEVVSP